MTLHSLRFAGARHGLGCAPGRCVCGLDDAQEAAAESFYEDKERGYA